MAGAIGLVGALSLLVLVVASGCGSADGSAPVKDGVPNPSDPSDPDNPEGTGPTPAAGGPDGGYVLLTSSKQAYRVSAQARASVEAGTGDTICPSSTVDACTVHICGSNDPTATAKAVAIGKVTVDGGRVPVTFEPGTKDFYAAGPGDLFEGSTFLRVRADASAAAAAFDIPLATPPLLTAAVEGAAAGTLEVDRAKVVRITWPERGPGRTRILLRENAFESSVLVSCVGTIDAGAVTIPAQALANLRETIDAGGRGDVTATLDVATITEADVAVAGGARAGARAERSAPLAITKIVIR